MNRLLKFSSKNAAELSGAAEEFCCLSLHCSQSLRICEQCRLTAFQLQIHGSARRAGSVAVASRHRNACRLRAVADARRQRDSPASVFPWAELYRAESRADLRRLEPLHDRLRLWSF